MPNTRDVGLPNQPAYQSDAETVTDSVTGLVWQRVLDAPMTADKVDAYCTSLVLAGECDWRAPERIELVSIVRYVNQSPAIDLASFAGTQAEKFWSRTPDVVVLSNRWFVDFTDGVADTTAPTEVHRVRCVRGGPVAPVMRYDIQPQIVTDVATKLLWQRTIDAGTYTFDQANAYCAALGLGGTWRMPSIGELQTLIDTTVKGPSIDLTAFPTAPIDVFWTGSLRSMSTTSGWIVNFTSGVANRSTTVGLRVRCVR